MLQDDSVAKPVFFNILGRDEDDFLAKSWTSVFGDTSNIITFDVMYVIQADF